MFLIKCFNIVLPILLKTKHKKNIFGGGGETTLCLPLFEEAIPKIYLSWLK